MGKPNLTGDEKVLDDNQSSQGGLASLQRKEALMLGK